MMEAMAQIDISSPEAARKAISLVTAHLKALDQFLERISSPTEERLVATKSQKHPMPLKALPHNIGLEVHCSCTAPGDSVVVVGSCPELGNWDVEKGLRLQTSPKLFPKWKGLLRMESSPVQDMQFKVAILRPSSHEWEEVHNRDLCLPIEDEKAGGEWEAALTFNVSEMKVVQAKPAQTMFKENENPLPNLLWRGHGGAATEFAEAKVEKLAIPQDVLDRTFKDKVVGYHRGVITEGQKAGHERKKLCFGQIPLNPPPYVRCEKGSKRTTRQDIPNQDNWSMTAFKSGWTLFCVHDGHGPFGHYVSTRTVQTVPWYLIEEGGFDKASMIEESIQQALLNAFEKAEKDLVLHARENKIDIAESGSTALAVLLKGNKIWTANLGDCRCVIGSGDAACLFQTADQKPQCHQERARIEAAGGEVRFDEVCHRIFIRDREDPGLAVARAFGDLGIKEYGVIAVPEVVLTEVDVSKHIFVFVASDGIWEFMDSTEVVEGVASKARKEGSEEILTQLHFLARCKWTDMCDGTYCDDITSLLVQLR